MRQGTLFVSVIVFFALIMLSLALYKSKGASLTFFVGDIKPNIQEEETPNLSLRQGLLSQGRDTIDILRGKNVVGVVILDEPIIVAQADKKERWGFFQFPSIYRIEDSLLIVAWQMAEDSHTSYGHAGEGRMMSIDEGKTWTPLDKDYYRKGVCRVELNNGDELQVVTPAVIDITKIDAFPKQVSRSNSEAFFFENELPEVLSGIYLKYSDKDHYSRLIHAKLNDPGLLRSAIDGLMSVIWLGDIKELEDGTLMSGVYPSYYLNAVGEVSLSGISFYKSLDGGNDWRVVGKIPYELIQDEVFIKGYENEGFTEPAFEVLEDGSFICVMRTGHYSPLYKSISNDKGEHWSNPEPFTPNGVNPRLLLLENGVLVLSSGRPGVQLRFNIDGDGDNWTEPIDMLPIEKYAYRIDLVQSRETCGYTGIMAVDDHTFYIVYSDFDTKNVYGEERKSIVFRKVEVVKIDKCISESNY